MIIKLNGKDPLTISDKVITPLQIAKQISLSLSKNAVGAVFGEKVVELDYPITSDGDLTILTKQDEKSLFLLNHTASHILAEAVTTLYPNAKLAIGPAIKDGFYYDIDFGQEVLSEKDLITLEKTMNQIVKKDVAIVRQELTKTQALEQFKSNPYKTELINEHSQNGETITVYDQQGFADLCGGGHVSRTGIVKYFKLLSIAGAYWRGDSKNKMLTRIYGCAFWSKEALDNHLQFLAECKERDHRKLGKELDMFFVDPSVGQGLPFWLEKGATVRRIIERYIVDKEVATGYCHVYTPVMANVSLYETSGHWEHYQDSMFPPMEMEGGERLVLRPMNCPHHMMIYKNKLHSYRDLPLRIAELGMMHRFEKSGALSGLQRVREMTLNDAHIFVTLEQVKEEFSNILSLLMTAYRDFKITDYRFRLSYRDENDKEKYFPDDTMWQNAQAMLKQALDELGIKYYEAIGEAAFYGPKLDVQIKTALGHEETLSTIQLDFLLPQRFNLKYIDKDGTEKTPVVIHRGIVSTMERFVAYLLEEYKGVFPLWLAPQQVVIIPVNHDLHLKYATQVLDKLIAKGIRASIDKRSEKLGYLIRDNITQKLPYIIVLGDSEKTRKEITYRRYGQNQNETTSLVKFIKQLEDEIASKK